MRISRAHPQTYIDLESLWTEHENVYFAFFGAPPRPRKCSLKLKTQLKLRSWGLQFPA